MRLLPALALTFALPALAGVGFRHDGTGVFPDARPPAAWSGDDLLRFRVPLAGPSNASPVKWGALVCVTIEPTTVSCNDADTGALRWTGEHPVLDALTGAVREEAAEIVRRAEVAIAREASMKAEIADLQRRVRARDATAEARLQALQATAQVDADHITKGAPYLTRPLDPNLGWSSPTPATDGATLYTFFANGVVAAWAPDGTRRWIRWLGPRTQTLEFYDGVPTASPVLAGGHLVVAYNGLHALDPATGEPAWEVPGWVDYGTPTVADVDGLTVILTPDGRVIGADDGVVHARGLGHHPWFNGPLWADGVATWVGGKVKAGAFRNAASAVQLRREGAQVVATPLWTTELPTRDRFYGSPLQHGPNVLAVDNTGRLWVIDAASGSIRSSNTLLPNQRSQVFAGPLAAGDRVFVPFHDGTVVELHPTDLSAANTWVAAPGMASPWFEGGRVWVRGRNELLSYGG